MRYDIQHDSVTAISFGSRGGGPFWTIATRYLLPEPGRPHSVSTVTAWDIQRGLPIASAELPGQALSAEWKRGGSKLALFSLVEASDLMNRPNGELRKTWGFPPLSTFRVHRWDVEVVGST